MSSSKTRGGGSGSQVRKGETGETKRRVCLMTIKVRPIMHRYLWLHLVVLQDLFVLKTMIAPETHEEVRMSELVLTGCLLHLYKTCETSVGHAFLKITYGKYYRMG